MTKNTIYGIFKLLSDKTTYQFIFYFNGKGEIMKEFVEKKLNKKTLLPYHLQLFGETTVDDDDDPEDDPEGTKAPDKKASKKGAQSNKTTDQKLDEMITLLKGILPKDAPPTGTVDKVPVPAPAVGNSTPPDPEEDKEKKGGIIAWLGKLW